MYTVIAVDDEPVALEHICTIIKLKCPEYTMIETAENGEEAMEKVRKFHPDMVISDVKMPIMNGIQLVGKIKEEFPDIFTIIVSGYQEFEYAKEALKFGVCDYILKPVMPSNMENILIQVAEKLKKQHYQQRNRLIRRICHGIEIDDAELSKYFPSKRYYGAIIRKNGLPRRFSNNLGMEIFSDINEMMYIYGRDEMEALYICPEELIFDCSFEQVVRHILMRENQMGQYITTVVLEEPFPVNCVSAIIKKIYRMLDTKTVIGYTQTLTIKDIYMPDEQERTEKAEESLEKLEYLLKEQRYDKFKKELEWLFIHWEEKHYPQLWVEGNARQLLYMIQKLTGNLSYNSDYEFMMEDAFYYALSMGELLENLNTILFKNIKGETADQGKVDTPEFFAGIKKYIRQNLKNPLTLQSVCKEFGVSQTYLSKLFRKYENASFNNYLTAKRMDKAKQLMEEDKDLFVKDLAAMIGYTDQFYFSRIFRSFTGMCPSDYLDGLQE